MPHLDKGLRRHLAAVIQQARQIAEEGAEEALGRLGVAEERAPAHVTGAAADLRLKLRAHARGLGDGWDAGKRLLLSTERLKQAAAFEHWHRMLFGRFLVERGLLVHPVLGAAIARDELADIAREEGLPDEWTLVERIAAPALPAVFKFEDPVLSMGLAPEHAKRLRDLVSGLPEDVFVAEDSLGWTYQFWRAAEKDAVNRSGTKVGAAELPAVTQLFTEPYMVLFLLHNTFGAWWAGKVLSAHPALAHRAANEAELRAACALGGVDWEYLRFVRDGEALDGPWRPAAGTFPNWPERVGQITFCDPCCGSGHFLVEAFRIIAALRQHEEGLSAPEAARAVLRDNLHGLELDGRCVQIAAFNVALAAWTLAGEPCDLPTPQIAWVGAPPPLSRTEMGALADGDAELAMALEALHDQFAQAPILGSLMEIGARDLLDDVLRERGVAALAKLRSGEPERSEGAVAARGLLDAAALLSRRYVLVATNVPFLGRRGQSAELADFLARRFPTAKTDLATAMLARINHMVVADGALAVVTPQNWFFLGSYAAFRRSMLTETQIVFAVALGEEAWETFGDRGPLATLSCFSACRPREDARHMVLDLTGIPARQDKIALCATAAFGSIRQVEQVANPDSRIAMSPSRTGVLLARYAVSYQGVSPADLPRFGRTFWEGENSPDEWRFWQSTVEESTPYGGRELKLHFGPGLRAAIAAGQAFLRGQDGWGRSGVAVRQMRNLSATLSTGEPADTNTAIIVPHEPSHLPAVWAFCSSPEYLAAVRRIDRKLNVTNATLVKVSFDIAYWQQVAAERFPNGLPEPHSDDPTQWLFHGHPAYAVPGTELHVALARLAGYRWPAETDAEMRLAPLAREHVAAAATLPATDVDGLLLLHTTAWDRSLADRLRDLLAAAYGATRSNTQEQALIRAADTLLDRGAARDSTLEGWLRDRAFRQHCVLFHQRPFLWHVWDGLTDGFSAVLHYHRLDRAALEKLTYTLLGDWISRAKDEGLTARHECALRLQQRLVDILAGEDPYDIFVRWKPMACQPVGWEPDLDDGVRLNIRPFVTAGVLRNRPKLDWAKDRGTDIASAPWHHLGPTYGHGMGARVNDHHLTRDAKLKARAKAAE